MEGGSSKEETDILIQKHHQTHCLLELHGIKCFQALLLNIISRPLVSLSLHVSVTGSWEFKGQMRGETCLSMTLDQRDYLNTIWASGENFVSMFMGPKDDELDIRGGRLPDGDSITSCFLYEKSGAVLLTAVSSDGSRICMVPSASCPLRKDRLTAVEMDLDDLVGRQDSVNMDLCRTRSVPSMQIMSPFAASHTRGVALALFAPRNLITVYDLEEDEDNEEEDGDENVE